MPTFLAITSRGIENPLRDELTELGFKSIKAVQGGFTFETNWKGAYEANLRLRAATRVALPILDFPAYEPDHLYHNVLKHDFTKYIDVKGTLAVDATVKDSVFKDQRFVALKVKDAIVDQFREKYGERPNVDSKNPDLTILARVYKNNVSLSIDTTGEGLFKRGYRQEQVPAPMKEHVAAGLLRIAKWDGRTPLVDPMCGGGTILIEAALQALDIAPGSLRKSFAFQRMKGFQADAWDEVVNEAAEREKTELGFKLYGFDRSKMAITAAKINARKAGVDEVVEFAPSQVSLLEPPCEHGIVIVNPPYGERMGHNDASVADSYRDLGFAMKTRFKGWTMWMLSPSKEVAQLIGMKSSERHTVWNGPIELNFLKYEIKK
ncbi:MAG TPA: THUMP domain-containing protein [Bdellovibrionales bacterium]|nr:THUMP domain-containing protein [Bdellovibrionales bacterium]